MSGRSPSPFYAVLQKAQRTKILPSEKTCRRTDLFDHKRKELFPKVLVLMQELMVVSYQQPPERMLFVTRSMLSSPRSLKTRGFIIAYGGFARRRVCVRDERDRRGCGRRHRQAAGSIRRAGICLLPGKVLFFFGACFVLKGIRRI